MKKYVYLAIIVLLNIINAASAQSPACSVSGRVIDEQKKGVPGALVQIIKSTDTTKKYNTLSDTAGNFLVSGLDKGSFKLYVSFISYNTTTQEVSVKDDSVKLIKVGNIQIRPSKNELKEVKITAERPFMSVEPDKTVFDAGKIGAVSSSTAQSLLEQIPLVNIDQSGNVTIRGKAAGVLIDGKPSPYSDISTALEMIQASSIDRVEVMTSPSSKYDASGQGGMINIILKKNIKTGLNGIINFDAGSRPDYHTGTDLNYRDKHWNLFGNLNYHTNTIGGNRRSEQYFPLSASDIIQKTVSTIVHHDLDSRFGFGYSFNDKTDISFTQNIGYHQQHSNASLSVDSGMEGNSPLTYGDSKSYLLNGDHIYSSTVDFSKRFAKDGEELKATAQFVTENTNVKSDLINDDGNFYNTQTNSGDGSNRSFLLQADYTDPVNKNDKIETGYKGTWLSNRNSVNAYLLNDSTSNYIYNKALSNDFSYRQQIQSIYGLYTGKIGLLNYKAGVRAELSVLSGTSSLTDTTFSGIHLNVFPSVYLSTNLSTNENIGIAYDTRIARPNFIQLLPYTDISNPINHQSGNPALNSAYTNHVEINYSKLFSGSNSLINIALYYSSTANSIQLVSFQEPGYLLTMPENIGSDITEGIDVVYRLNVKKVMSLTGTFDINYNRFNSRSTENNLAGWNTRLHLDGSINLPDQFIFAAHGEITGPQHLPQGYMNMNRGIDAELRHSFIKERLTIAAIVSDIFNQRQQTTHLTSDQFIENDVYREDSRMLHLHLSYNF